MPVHKQLHFLIPTCYSSIQPFPITMYYNYIQIYYHSFYISLLPVIFTITYRIYFYYHIYFVPENRYFVRSSFVPSSFHLRFWVPLNEEGTKQIGLRRVSGRLKGDKQTLTDYCLQVDKRSAGTSLFLSIHFTK